MDTRLGSLSIHLDTPQCFSAEMYSADLNIAGKPEDDKVYSFKFTVSSCSSFFLPVEVLHVGYYLFFVDIFNLHEKSIYYWLKYVVEFFLPLSIVNGLLICLLLV